MKRPAVGRWRTSWWNGPDGRVRWRLCCGSPGRGGRGGQLRGPWQNRDRYGSVGVVLGTWRVFLEPGCEDCPPFFLASRRKLVEGSFVIFISYGQQCVILVGFWVFYSGRASGCTLAE